MLAKKGFEDEKTIVVPWDLIPGQVTVLAMCDIKKGELVTTFDGRVFTREETAKASQEESDYMVYIHKNEYRCGLYAMTGNGHLINSNYRDIHGYHHRSNCRLVVPYSRTQVSIRATQNIRAGTELLVSYGKGYWVNKKKL